MADIEGEEYEFWIDAFSPKSIPMQRLGEYMAQLGRLLGHEDSVHFRKLTSGSTTLNLAVRREAVPKVEDRIDSIRRSAAANDATDAQTQLNNMLRDDSAVGEFRRIRQGHRKPLLRLAGREIPKPPKVGPFNEPASFKGELVRIEGEDDTKHAGIKDAQGRLWSGYMSRELAVHMRQFLFEWVLVQGLARWMRNDAGEWELLSFHVNSCDLLPKDTLQDDIKKLRDIPGNQWREMNDPLGFIRESRNDDDEIH